MRAIRDIFIQRPDRPAFAEGIVAIVNAGNDVSEISLSDLKKIYLMKKKTWPNGRDIMVWLPPSGGAEMDLC